MDTLLSYGMQPTAQYVTSQFKTHESGGITVPMELEPLESAFIVFRNDAVAPTTYSTNYPNPDIISDLTDKPWTIEFDAKRQGPSQPLAIDSLIDWSTHPTGLLPTIQEKLSTQQNLIFQNYLKAKHS